MISRTFKLIALLSAVLILQGCRLAIIVVEGGEVHSTASGICVAGSICIVDVSDPYFSETFTAVPDEGWYFHKWNSGDRLFCGDEGDLECTLSFEGYEEREDVKEMVESSELFYLMPIFRKPMPITDTITVNGKVWAQPDLFTNVDFFEIFRICHGETCSGVVRVGLNGYDMTGWIWASIEDTNTLFNHYLGSDELGPWLSHFEAAGTRAPWATAFFADGWRSTSSSDFAEDEVRFVDGWVSDYESFDATVYTARLVDVLVAGEEFTHDSATTRYLPVSGESFKEHPTRGAWFYRKP